MIMERKFYKNCLIGILLVASFWVWPVTAKDYIYFDNTKWQVVEYGSWDGSEWDAEYTLLLDGVYFLFLDAIDSWSTGFRPTSVTITYTGAERGLYLTASDESETDEIFSGSIDSGTPAYLTFGINDLNSLFMYSLDTFSITNIVFRYNRSRGHGRGGMGMQMH